MNSFNNKRAHLRVKPAVHRPIEVQISGTGFLELVRARDISEGGIAIYVSHGFEGIDIEAEVELIITLPHARPFAAKGQIRHRSVSDKSVGHFGVQFTQLSEHDREKVAAYVKERMANGGSC